MRPFSRKHNRGSGAMMMMVNDDESLSSHSSSHTVRSLSKRHLHAPCPASPPPPSPATASPSLRRSAGCRKLRLSVRFDESRNECTKTAANAKFAQVCWYSAEEYQQVKLAVLLLAKQLSNGTSSDECKYRRVMTSIFSSCCRVPLEIDTSQKSFLCDKDQQDFIKCMVNSNSRLGLERLTIQALQEDAIMRRKLLLETIVNLQQKKQQEQQQEPSSSSSSSSRAELIQRTVESLTRPSRLFAREKARAMASRRQQQQPTTTSAVSC